MTIAKTMIEVRVTWPGSSEPEFTSAGTTEREAIAALRSVFRAFRHLSKTESDRSLCDKHWSQVGLGIETTFGYPLAKVGQHATVSLPGGQVTIRRVYT